MERIAQVRGRHVAPQAPQPPADPRVHVRSPAATSLEPCGENSPNSVPWSRMPSALGCLCSTDTCPLPKSCCGSQQVTAEIGACGSSGTLSELVVVKAEAPVPEKHPWLPELGCPNLPEHLSEGKLRGNREERRAESLGPRVGQVQEGWAVLPEGGRGMGREDRQSHQRRRQASLLAEIQAMTRIPKLLGSALSPGARRPRQLRPRSVGAAVTGAHPCTALGPASFLLRAEEGVSTWRGFTLQDRNPHPPVRLLRATPPPRRPPPPPGRACGLSCGP